jgi:hypothetical protein
MRQRGAREEQEMNTASDWLFNLMLWGAIVTLLVLCVHVLVAPILGGMVSLIGLAVVVILSALWPKW